MPLTRGGSRHTVGDMLITHHGHSCIELSVGGATVLFDPGSFSEFDDVRGVDAVVVTHRHADHLDPEKVDMVRANNPDATWYAEPQTAAQLREKGIEVTETAAGETYRVAGARLEGVGATHAEIHPYIERIGNVGIVVTADDEPRLFHPGDSLEGRPRDVDYLCVPVSAPWSAVKDTIAFVRAVQPGKLIPIHDKVCSEVARGMYLGHIGDHGLDGGIEVVDVAQGETRELG